MKSQQYMSAEEHALWMAKTWNSKLPADKQELKAIVEYDRHVGQVTISIMEEEVVRYLPSAEDSSIRPVVVNGNDRIRAVFMSLTGTHKATVNSMVFTIPNVEWTIEVSDHA